MILTFLSAAVPLSKTLTYAASADIYTTSAYPMVRKVTSHEVEVATMFDFGVALIEQGAQKRCLLYGQVDRPLVDESRAGRAMKDVDHEWVCFDFDKVPYAPTLDGAEQAIKELLPACCQGVECIVQLSPSCYLPTATKLSAHVFMRLRERASTKKVKDFLVWCNFQNEKLKSLIGLTDNAHALTMRLDRCVADPSRLIYIAPPRTVGYTSTITPDDAICHIPGDDGFIIPSASVSRDEEHAYLRHLRTELGLPEREFRLIKFRGHDVLEDIDEGIITDVRPSGDGYIRFNINGGDSLAYWINLKDPEIIGNFKGEPFMMTRKVSPDFYKALLKTVKAIPKNAQTKENVEVLAFYGTNHGSQLYIGTYDRDLDLLRVDKSTETAAQSWLHKHGVPSAEEFPHYDLLHDISSDVRYEEGYPVINLYARTDLMKQYGGADRVHSLDVTMANIAERCPITHRLLQSVAGDPKSAASFVNWLAYIFQTRTKTGTAWLFWGTEGTGKGLLIEHVCKPLFSESSVSQVMMSSIEHRFNTLLEGKLLVNVDEVDMTRTRDTHEAMAKLRNWITEPNIIIEDKGKTAREVPSFANFIFCSNSFRPISINPGDRRFHVGTRQEHRLLPTTNEFAKLVQGEELPAFAEELGKLIVSEKMVRQPEMNEQKAKLFESTHSVLDSVAMAVRTGDTDFFFEARPSNVMLNTMQDSMLMPIREYDELLRAMHNNTLNVLRHEDLYTLFSVVVNDNKVFPTNVTAQRKIFTRYGLTPARGALLDCARTGHKQHGVPGPTWAPAALHLQDVIKKPEETGDVIPMRGRK